MAFFEKTKDFLTGKTDLERKQQKAALKEIRKKVTSARYKERKEQAIKFAVEKERHDYSERLKKLKQPKGTGTGGFSSSGFGNYGGIMGQPRFGNTKNKQKSVGNQKRFNVITGTWE